jgi:peptidoglycan/xylan/chitin deacetylase (PgdA/CDA1 family)
MMEWFLGAATLAGAAASARWAWWRKSTEGLAVLMYHKIGQPPKDTRLKPLWVSTEAFEGQMIHLKEDGYTTLLFSELGRAAEEGRPLPPKPVLVTFDDGYRNNYLEAFPVLMRHGLKGNVFLVYETIGKHNQWHDPETEPWLSMLRWEDIREMDRSRRVEFGSHTMRHRNLEAVEFEDARWELEESKRRFEDALGREFPFFAYPYGAGAFSPRIREATLKAGYRFDFGIQPGKASWPHTPETGPLPRLFIRWSDSRLDFRLKMTRGAARLWGDGLRPPASPGPLPALSETPTTARDGRLNP